ncbi:MAG: trypsin-like peptidase domain-containing protein [Anaerolineae bacterium]|nr:trypsin-like peptidase domain-containing protein [Anaerolineae bacterium]
MAAVDSALTPVDLTPPFKPIPFLIREGISKSGVEVSLPVPDLSQVFLEDAQPSSGPKGRRIGIVRQLPSPVTILGKQASSGTWHTLKDGGTLWTLTAQSKGALGIRVHLEDVSLPSGTQIILYNIANPTEVYGPYDVTDLYGRSDFWTETVFGSTVGLELYLPPTVDVASVRFQVRELVHMYLDPTAPSAVTEASCHNDVTCHSAWATEASGTALFTITVGGLEFACTGALLNTYDNETWTGYFLTANHCLSDSESALGTQQAADTMEFFWLFQTSQCNGTPPDRLRVPRTGGGADLVANRTRNGGNDFALVRIRRAIPGGLSLLGWTTWTPGANDVLTGIHHPGGTFKRISFGSLASTNSNYWTVRWSSGIIEHGSSGSPLFDRDHRIVGQLSAGTLPLTCANTNLRGEYGRFAVTYPVVERWMKIGGTINVNRAYNGNEQGTPEQPYNTISEALALAWDRVRIKVRAGSYRESMRVTRPMTIIANGGTVTIGR